MSSAAQPTSDRKEQYTHGHDQIVTRVMGQRTAATHAAFFTPYLRSGMRLLDCGCGPGSITLGLAEIVAPGEAVGVDMAENQLEQARAAASAQGVSNTRFEPANVYALPFPDESFDAVFSHAVVEHLREPLAALREMRRVLKPGGVLGLRNADRAGELFWPPDPTLLKFHDVWSRLGQHNGGDPFIGRRLRALLNATGLARVEASAAYETHGTAESVRHIVGNGDSYIAGPFADQVIALGWLDRAEVDRIREAWKAWGENPDAFWARTWCEAVGWKA